MGEAQGVHLNPLAVFLHTSIQSIWSILREFLPSRTPWLRDRLVPRLADTTGALLSVEHERDVVLGINPIVTLENSY